LNTRVILIIAALVLAGGVLRFYKLTYQSLWYDEIHTVLRSGPEVSIPSIMGYAENSEVDQPPVFFLYTHFILKAFGVSDITVRLGSVLMGLLAIPVMYFLGREVVNSETGIFAATLTTVNYFHIFHSQEARFYTLLFLLSALSYLFMVRAFKYVRIIDFVLYSLFTVLLLYTHYFGIVVFAAQVLTFVVLVFYKWNDRKFIIFGFASGLLICLAFLPWLPIVLKHNQVGSFWVRKPTWYFMLDYVYNYLGKDAVQVALFAFFIFLFVRQFIKKDYQELQSRQVYLILILWLLISYLIPYIRSIVSTPILHMRYMIISLPAWILVFSAGWSAIANKKRRIGLMVALIVISLANLVFFRKHYTKIQKTQIREAALLVKNKNDRNTPVLSTYCDYYQYYFNNGMTILRADTSLVSKEDRFWLLQLQALSPEELTQELKLFEDKFNVAESHQFHGTAAILLTRKPKMNPEPTP
jgi:uncharacterized membrane protein